MSNNVRGPTSALTEFLRASGITPTTVARRAATRAQQQAAAGPSGTQVDDAVGAEPSETRSAPSGRRTRTRSATAAGYNSDDLDADDDAAQEEEEKPAVKKRKLTKAAEAKLKAKEKAKTKGKAKGKKGADEDEDDSEEEEEDAYNALSKMWSGTGASPAKPPVGNFEDCAKCEKQFTVTKYTMAANPGPGFLCHQCAKASGSDPFKKPAVPKRRKAPADKRSVVNFEERRFPTLVSMCIQLITKHIDDVEALGDIGTMNVDAISKALSKNRGLTPQNATLFYNITNTALTLYDATNLPSPALTTLAHLNPNLTTLRLDFCGHLDDPAMNILSTGLPALTSLELLGPFLVRTAAWKDFFTSHPALTAFRITQSPRFDIECMRVLVDSCGQGLEALRLREVGKLDDAFCAEVARIAGMQGEDKKLVEIDLADPSLSCSEDAIIEMLEATGASLRMLNLSKHDLLSDVFLEQGLGAYTRVLEHLTLSHLPLLTDAGVGAFFGSWANQPLTSLDLARNAELGNEALLGILGHSGKRLEVLNINGWKDVDEKALRWVGKMAPELRRVDVGWCREVDDFLLRDWMVGDGKGIPGCAKLREIKVWGCNKVTAKCPKKSGVSIFGVESHSVS
ncbi:DNA repair protein rhp7 [Hypsizygus marmoreus]|uniref:DNA repair protein rhp7 n=1 Tax=Hypsizygus marmoreus TaxID=39966 RepID=A0A369JBJ7_HYPMA|nr:DNA repair protein rhp7 [Hypsizygus marmoreus]